MDTPSRDKLALFIITPQFLTNILSKGMCAKPTHGIKDMTPISLGIDRTGNLILCISSDSIPEYIAYKKCVEQSVPLLLDTPVLNGVEMPGIPILTASFEEVHPDGQTKFGGDRKHD